VKIRRVVIPALVLVAASLAPTASADRPDDRAGVRAPGMIAAHSSVRPDDRAGTRGAAGVSDSVELATADRPDDRVGARGPDGGVIVAAAAEPAPAAFDALAYRQTEGSTPQGLKADGLRWEGIARAYESRPAANYYTPQALRAEGLRWTAMARTYESRLGSVDASVDKGFNWDDAGIGAAGGLGLAVFAVAVVIFARHLRRAKLAL